MLKRFYQFAIVGAIAFGLVACGGEKPAAETTTEETETVEEETTETETATEEEELVAEEEMTFEQEVELNAIGEDMAAMAYEPAELVFPAYTNIKLNFNNKATALGMSHNAVIIPADEAIANEVRKAGMKPSTDERIVAQTEILEPGQNTSIVFETPGPGQYYVVCTYPGHSNMIAQITVE